MKSVYLTSLLFISQLVVAQNVGIGTATPDTKLDIEGAISMKIQSVAAGATITIPKDVSIVRITDDAANAANVTTTTSPQEGQLLTIYNNDAQAVSFASETIEAQIGTASFVFINGSWRLTSKNNTSWLTKGNNGMTPSNTDPIANEKANNNFIGTTDGKDLVFTTNGYERMRIKTAADGLLGKIGIGTSNPVGKLSIFENENNDLATAVTIEENNNGGALSIYETGEGNGLHISSTGEGSAISSELTGSITSGNAVGHAFSDLRTNNTISNGNKTSVWIESKFNFLGDNIGLLVDVDGGTTNTSALFRGGNVGIGNFLTGPTTYLDINVPNVNTTSTQPGILNVMSNNTGGAADIGGSISLGGNRNSDFRVYGTIEGRKSLSSTSSSSGYLMFKTNNAGILSERMRIFEDGYVRINSLAGAGVRIVIATTDGILDAVKLSDLETDPSWNELGYVVGSAGLLTRAGRVLTNSSFINGTAITTVTGPGIGADNQYHNVPFSSSQTAMTGISIYATGTHLDGDIKIFGIAMTDLLTTTTGWYGVSAGATSAGSATNTNSTGADDQYHTAQCPNNRIATGIEIYASSALDGYMKLRCNALTTGYSTSETGMGIESLINTPFKDANDITHMSTCPAGTFVKGIKIYASSRLDNQMQVFCTGIKKN